MFPMHGGFMGKKKGVNPCAYVPGLYTQAEVDDLINIDGYIPVADADEFDKIRTGAVETMGGCSIWAGSYTTGVDKQYIQIFDIDWDGATNGDFSAISGISFFTGTYDGNNFEVINLQQTEELASTALSIFGINQGTIKNLTIRARTGFAFRDAAFTRQARQGAIYQDLFAYGNIDVAGGGINRNFTFSADGNIRFERCFYSGILTAGGACGGITQTNTTALRTCEIIDCETEGTLNGTAQIIGGIGGNITTGSTVRRCKTSMVVNGATSNVGGFAGQITGSALVEECYATGAVTGTGGNNYGGFVGFMTNTATVRNCYAIGNVSTPGSSGGAFVGLANGATMFISNCYALGTASDSGGARGFASFASAASITSCHWDTDTNGSATSGGGAQVRGRTTPQMQEGTEDSYILPAGGIDGGSNPANLMYENWDAAIWRFTPTNAYPELINTP